MKFILNESTKFILNEKFILTETIDKTKYPNIVKFYPDSAQINNFWASLGLRNVDEFNADMLKRLDSYFGADWITKEHCDELIKTASSLNKGMNYTGVKALFAKFEKEQKEAVKKPEENSVNNKNNSSIDWEQEYKDCKSAEEVTAFWNRYFEQEWNNNEDIISLRDLIAIEAKNYGWTEKANPFIYFLKHHYEGCLDQSKPSVKGKYTELHNAVVNRLISGADLKEAGVLKERNVIFNPNLYKKSATDMEAYLELQRDIISEARNSDKYSVILGANPGRFLNNIMLAAGDTATLAKEISYEGELRSLAEIKDLKATLFPEKETLNNQELISADDIDQIIKKVTSKELATNLLAFLFLSLRPNYGNLLDKLNSALGSKLSQLSSPSFDQIERYYNEYKLGAKFTNAQAEKLIMGLAKVAGFAKTA